MGENKFKLQVVPNGQTRTGSYDIELNHVRNVFVSREPKSGTGVEII